MAVCELTSFAERDIDVWLAEELRFNASFCRWFLEQVGVAPIPSLPAYRCLVSVTDETGREDDVQAFFRLPNGGTFALLVEDKIKAAFQPNQMEDYLERGHKGVRLSSWNAFAVVVFAPSYRQLYVPDEVKIIKFDAAAKALQEGALNYERIEYRATFLQQANKPSAKIMHEVDDETKAWWSDVHALVREKYGEFLLEPNPSNDSFVSPRWQGQPSFLRLDIKGRAGQVALALKGVSEEAARDLLSRSECAGLAVVKKASWVDPAIVVTEEFTKYAVGDDLTEAQSAILSAYGGAYRLYEFWRENSEAFARLASR